MIQQGPIILISISFICQSVVLHHSIALVTSGVLLIVSGGVLWKNFVSYVSGSLNFIMFTFRFAFMEAAPPSLGATGNFGYEVYTSVCAIYILHIPTIVFGHWFLSIVYCLI